MIVTKKEHLGRYAAVHPAFARVAEVLEEFVKNPPALGRIEIDGDTLFANSQSYTPRLRDGKFEVHRKYIDVQFLLSGREEIDVCDLSDLTETDPYKGEIEASFGVADTYSTVVLRAGELAILFPEDAHRPGITSEACGEVRKIIVKVAL